MDGRREHSFQALAENMPDEVIRFDRELRHLYVNPAAERILGRPRQEILGRTVREAGVPFLAEGIEQAVRQTFETLEEMTVEVEIPTDTGPRLHEARYVPEVSPSGDANSVLVVCRDVTERHAMETALRASEERARSRALELQTVLDTVPAAVWIARDPSGDHIETNRFGADLLRIDSGQNVSLTAPGGGPRNFVVRRNGLVLGPDELPLQAVARRGGEIRDYEEEIVFNDGSTRHLLGSVTPLRDGSGEPWGSVGAFLDITARKGVEEALRRSEERIRAADGAKTKFIAVLSHELRNALAPIRNSVILLERTAPESGEARLAREALGRQSRHLMKLVDDLLDLTRITHGKIVLSRSRVNAADVARGTAEDVREAFDRRRVRFEVEIPPEPVWVEADPVRLSQMIGNLLFNAAKFTPPGGKVQLAIGARSGACEVLVRDNGVGIAFEELELIFDPFTQSERTSKVVQGGMGIGLALVRDLAKLHAGSVHAASDGPGRGATFVLSLPLSAPPHHQVIAAPRTQEGRPARILLIEDNADAGQTLARLLMLEGHEVQLATTGREGIEDARRRRPDALIRDLGLPDMSGHDVVRALKDAGAVSLAIALTGYAQPEDRERAFAAGFDAHLAKPAEIEELRVLLARGQKGL